MEIRDVLTNIKKYDAWDYKNYPLRKEEADAIIENYKEPCEDCIKIPEGATNGDMIKAMFGEPAKISKKGVLYKFMHRNGKPYFSTFYDYEWWNNPYRKEQE